MIVMYEHRVETISAETWPEARDRAGKITDKLVADGWQLVRADTSPRNRSAELRFQRRVQE